MVFAGPPPERREILVRMIIRRRGASPGRNRTERPERPPPPHPALVDRPARPRNLRGNPPEKTAAQFNLTLLGRKGSAAGSTFFRSRNPLRDRSSASPRQAHPEHVIPASRSAKKQPPESEDEN